MKRKGISLVLLGLLIVVSVASMVTEIKAQSEPVLEVAGSIAPLAGHVNEVAGLYVETYGVLQSWRRGRGGGNRLNYPHHLQ